MTLFIHGIGHICAGIDEPHNKSTKRLEEIHISKWAKGSVRRRMGRPAQMAFVAAKRALENARLDNSDQIAIVTASSLGDTSVGLDTLSVHRRTMERKLRTWLLPNATHNAPAGHLSIALKSTSPSLTVSHGWLSAESAISAAHDLIVSDTSRYVLVVVGDEADPEWGDLLRTWGANEWADRLDDERFQEGAVALVLGGQPGENALGRIHSFVERCETEPIALKGAMMRHRIDHSSSTEVRIRANAGDRDLLLSSAEALERSENEIHMEEAGAGTSQTGPLAILAKHVENDNSSDLLFISREMDDLAVLHWSR